jgi:hypothetical protein
MYGSIRIPAEAVRYSDRSGELIPEDAILEIESRPRDGHWVKILVKGKIKTQVSITDHDLRLLVRMIRNAGYR